MIPRLFGESSDKDTQFIAAVKQNQEIIFIGGLLLVTLMVLYFALSYTAPREGTWRYGICKVFLERYAQYPMDLKILTAAEKQNSAQIGYLTTNSYGSRESELMECFYNTGETGVSISRITINRKTYNQEIVDDFNTSIPILLGNEGMDVTLPKQLPNTFDGLKFD